MRQGEVPDWKKEKVKELADMVEEYPVVGVVNMKNFPSKQLLKVKEGLHGTARIKMSKKSLIKRALKREDMEELSKKMEGQPALVFTKENPFKLSKFILKNRTSAPAKPGSVMPKEIEVKAGDTDFTPGPIVGELQKAGIKAAIESGKVVVKEDSVIAEEGEEVDKETADLMKKMKIEPMEIQLDLLAAYEDGVIFDKDILRIDTEKVTTNLKSAYKKSFNLAFNIEYPVKENAKLFVQKAFREGKSLALKADYVCPATAEELVSKADTQAKGLKEQLPEKPPEKEGKETSEEEKKEEEKSEEKEKPEKKEKEKEKPEKKEESEEKEKEPKYAFKDFTIPQLKKIADDQNVEIKSSDRKADIIEKIKKEVDRKELKKFAKKLDLDV